jgi:WD40 repeat protein
MITVGLGANTRPRRIRRPALLKGLAILTLVAIGCLALAVPVTTWRKRLALTEPGGGLLAFSPDGRILAQAVGRVPGESLLVRLWDAREGKLLRTLELPPLEASLVCSMAFAPDGSMLAVGCKTHAPGPNRARVWEVASGKVLATLDVEPLYMSSVRARFSSDGRSLHVLRRRGHWEPVLWDTARWQPLPIPGDDDRRSWIHADFSADGRSLVRATREGEIAVWDLVSGRRRDLVEARDLYSESLVISPDGKVMAVTETVDTGIVAMGLWDLDSGQRRMIPAPGSGPPVFAPDGRSLYRDGGVGWVDSLRPSDHPAEFWDVGSARRCFSLVARDAVQERIAAMAFSPDGRLVAVSDSRLSPEWLARLPLSARLWLLGHLGINVKYCMQVDLRDISTGRVKSTLPDFASEVEGLVFSPDGGCLATTGRHGHVILWDLTR